MRAYLGVRYDSCGCPVSFEWSDEKDANWGPAVKVIEAHADYDVEPGRMAYVTYDDYSFSKQIHGSKAHADRCAESGGFWNRVYSALYRRPYNR